MAIKTVVTRGYGNGTYNGTIPLVVTRGYLPGGGDSSGTRRQRAIASLTRRRRRGKRC